MIKKLSQSGWRHHNIYHKQKNDYVHVLFIIFDNIPYEVMNDDS